jgi:UDP-glucose 4-epimerase
MNALVTGGAGFLGRQVARHLAATGFEVSIFDRMDAADPDIPTIVGDLVDAETVRAAVDGHDVVCHIGAIGDVYLAGEQPALASSVNVTGTALVADAAIATGARVMYASTWEVYGEPRYEPIDEDHPTEPDHPYSITKLAGERILISAAHLRGLSTVALRLGTAYGPGLRPNSVFRIFIDRARRGEPITIQGGGSQGRQFTHSSDIARAFEMAARSDVTAQVFNTVADETVSIKQLAEMVVERIPTELTFGQPRPGDVPPALVSSQRITDVLGWRAEMPFDEGLRHLIDEG